MTQSGLRDILDRFWYRKKNAEVRITDPCGWTTVINNQCLLDYNVQGIKSPWYWAHKSVIDNSQMFDFFSCCLIPSNLPFFFFKWNKFHLWAPKETFPRAPFLMDQSHTQKKHHCVFGKRQWGPQGKLRNWGRPAPYFVHLSMLKECLGRLRLLPIVRMSKPYRKVKMPFEWLHRFCSVLLGFARLLSPWVLFTSLEMQMEGKC